MEPVGFVKDLQLSRCRLFTSGADPCYSFYGWLWRKICLVKFSAAGGDA